MSKPVFVLLHGAWHSPRCWDRVITALDRQGFSAVAPALPSTGSTPPTPDWSGDVETIRKTVFNLVRENHNVVVVAHSFSGLTAGTALEGLDKQACASKGLKGGAIRLVYINAFLVPEGFQHSPNGTRNNMVPEMKTDLADGTITVQTEGAKDMFYQDLDDKTVVELVKDLRPQSIASYWSTTTYAAWRYIPTTYMLCTRDRPTTVAAARHLIDISKASGPHKIDIVLQIEAGHSPFISMPEWTAEALVRVGQI